MNFRTLRADEIEVRIAIVKNNGVSLLLYKDARCDMNILDETVGNEKWQRNHEIINGNLFCNVGINVGADKWIWKQDVGTESYTEKEKGQASDSFKRACFNWGIGRELYTAPFIWISSQNCKINQSGNKFSCNDKFFVKEIEYDNKKISSLVIVNKESEEEVFSYPYRKQNKESESKPQQEESKSKPIPKTTKSKPIPKPITEPSTDLINELYQEGTDKGFSLEEITLLAVRFYKKKPVQLSNKEISKLKESIVTKPDKARLILSNEEV